MAIADAGTSFQISFIVDMNEIMLWRSFFETSKTTQNGKYTCSYFTTCGLTGTILYQNLASDVLYKQKRQFFVAGLYARLNALLKGKHLIVLHIGS
jgi:hypothetical protein